MVWSVSCSSSRLLSRIGNIQRYQWYCWRQIRQTDWCCHRKHVLQSSKDLNSLATVVEVLKNIDHTIFELLSICFLKKKCFNETLHVTVYKDIRETSIKQTLYAASYSWKYSLGLRCYRANWITFLLLSLLIVWKLCVVCIKLIGSKEFSKAYVSQSWVFAFTWTLQFLFSFLSLKTMCTYTYFVL